MAEVNKSSLKAVPVTWKEFKLSSEVFTTQKLVKSKHSVNRSTIQTGLKKGMQLLNRIHSRKAGYINRNLEAELEGQNSWKLWLKIILMNAAESTQGNTVAICGPMTHGCWWQLSARRVPGLSGTHQQGATSSVQEGSSMLQSLPSSLYPCKWLSQPLNNKFWWGGYWGTRRRQVREKKFEHDCS